MARHSTLNTVRGLLAIGLAMAGCSRGPARVRQPAIDPAAAAAKAVEAYDADRNGSIAGVELDASPALKSALERLDANRDGGVSADEITARIKAWKAMKTALTSVRCLVTLDGRPLPGATVTFEPEPFLGEHVKPAAGQTNQFGDAAPTVADADKPDPTLPGGVHFGFYTVRISKPAGARDGVPAHANEKSTLGLEVAYDEPGIRDNNLAFRVTSTP